jgi:hypothetical protein
MTVKTNSSLGAGFDVGRNRKFLAKCFGYILKEFFGNVSCQPNLRRLRQIRVQFVQDLLGPGTPRRPFLACLDYAMDDGVQ